MADIFERQGQLDAFLKTLRHPDALIKNTKISRDDLYDTIAGVLKRNGRWPELRMLRALDLNDHMDRYADSREPSDLDLIAEHSWLSWCDTFTAMENETESPEYDKKYARLQVVYTVSLAY